MSDSRCQSQKPSKVRYRAMLQDIERRAYYALYSKDYSNPYHVDDKRHDRFVKKLSHVRFIDADFDDMCEVMGTDTSQWTRRVHQNPGPVTDFMPRTQAETETATR